MKKILSVLFVLIIGFSLFASMYHSVPLDSKAYRIIDWAEVKGIIEPQIDVRPYNLDFVRSLLKEIYASEGLSAGERQEIEDVLSDFDRLYGNSESSDLKDIALNGFYRTSNEDGNTNAALGFMFKNDSRLGTDFSNKYTDIRNKISLFFRGDFMGVVSYDMNISGQIDRIDRNAFVFSDFSTEAEGAYMDYFSKGEKNITLHQTTADHFYAGLSALPEISASVKDGLFSARLGAINHDWGVGNGNLALSKTARNMDAIEFTIVPVSWINYSVITASLGKFEFADAIKAGYWPSEGWHKDEYDNNLVLHRVELGPFAGIKASVWEACVYRKRFELSYLNPFQIYLFAQNSLGDFDNVLVGADLSVTVKNIGTFYGAFSVDEFNKPKQFFSCPRNMMALQAGYKTALNLFEFTTINAQATYIPPFYGTHYGYDSSSNPWGCAGYKTTYVNKGQNLGYNLDPDSLELLLKAESSFKGFNFTAEARDILRSYQYATDPVNGQNMLTTMFYGNYNSGEYADKDFLHNIGENIVDLSVNAEKKFDNLPFTVSLGFDFIVDSKREIKNYNSIKQEAKNDDEDHTVIPDVYINPGKGAVYGDWTNTAKVVGCFSIKVYY